ncbi:MAG: GNAT family N-acetyltransferase, partial [Bdellovibrionales bacterium]|nr:GNAT family N-acetyltransferase [Bdellovibrionales bacterium]
RFRLDQKIPNSTFEFIYSEWLRKSLDGKFDDIVLVKDIPNGSKAAGLVTLRFSGEIARIGLIAARPEAQGLEVGKTLLLAAQRESLMRGCSSLWVTTQLANQGANRFYEKFGFKKVGQQKVIHWWSHGASDAPTAP